MGYVMVLWAEPVDVFHGFCFLLECVGKLLWLDGDGCSHEFGDVVAFEQLAVIVGIGCR